MSFCVCIFTKRSSCILFFLPQALAFISILFFFFTTALSELSINHHYTFFFKGLTGSNFSLCMRDVLSQRLLCAALKSGWPVEISISPLIILFSSVSFNMVHQCPGSFIWGTPKSCSVPVCISFEADLQAWPKECHRPRAALRVELCK